jgi:hypothetical protein
VVDFVPCMCLSVGLGVVPIVVDRQPKAESQRFASRWLKSFQRKSSVQALVSRTCTTPRLTGSTVLILLFITMAFARRFGTATEIIISHSDWGPKPTAGIDGIPIPPSQSKLQRLNLLGGHDILVRGPKPARNRQDTNRASKSWSREEIVPLQVFLGCMFRQL